MQFIYEPKELYERFLVGWSNDIFEAFLAEKDSWHVGFLGEL